jgi:hypothetical protein
MRVEAWRYRGSAKNLLLAAFLAFLPLPASQACFAEDFRDALSKELQPYRADCKNAGGELSGDVDKAITRIDLDGDGRPDAIVDMTQLPCTTDYTPYCGTGGCPLLIFRSLANGTYRRLFDGQVLSYEIEGKGKRKTIAFRLHGSFCGRKGPELCIKRVTITGRPFAFKQ